MAETIHCPISGQPMTPVFSEVVLGKHKVTYYYCEASGLLRTEPPYWLAEAYQDAITRTDIGLLDRNVRNSKVLAAITCILGLQNGKLLDLAGGYGVLTRLMRDFGFDCYTTDKYCQNLFAKTFEPGVRFKADILSTFEVLEHVEDPLRHVADAFQQYGCRTLVFSTLTFTGAVPPRDWPYYSFSNGQHITFYQPRTLALLAERLGCKYLMLKPGLHLITDRRLSGLQRRLILNPWLRKLVALCVQFDRRNLRKRKPGG